MRKRQRIIGLALIAFLLAFVAIQSGDTAPGPAASRAVYFTTREAGLAGNLAEAAATGFWSGSGVIQISILKNSGTGATAGVITVYQLREAGDAVYVEIPAAQYSLISNGHRISPPIDLGAQGYFKLVVSGFAGVYNYDLLVRDCNI